MRLDELRKLIREAVMNAYDILGINKGASDEEIRQAYKKKALEFHPDRNIGKPDTTAKMVQVNVARDMLMDPVKRAKLDAELSGRGGAKFNDFDDFIKNWRKHQQNAQQPRRDKAPPSQQPKQKQPFPRRYFAFISGTSRKFWSINDPIETGFGWRVEVKWGRLGTPGKSLDKYFSTWSSGREFIRSMIDSKLAKGYREVTEKFVNAPREAQDRGWEKQTGQRPPSKEEARPQRSPAGAKPGGVYTKNVKLYRSKLYGRPSARFRGQGFVAGKDTKFWGKNAAQASMGTDGKLRVTPVGGGDTQTWEKQEESVFFEGRDPEGSNWAGDWIWSYVDEHPGCRIREIERAIEEMPDGQWVNVEDELELLVRDDRIEQGTDGGWYAI